LAKNSVTYFMDGPFYPDLTTVIRCFMACQNLPFHCLPLLFTLQLV